MGINLYSYAIIFLIFVTDFKKLVNSISSRDYYDDKHQEYLIGKKGMNKERWEKILKSSGRCYRALLENLCCSSSTDLKHLKKLGIAKNATSGERILETNPSKRFYLPNLYAIKTFKDVRRMKEDDKIWLSVSYAPWHLDKQCEKYRVVFNTKEQLPAIALASFPRSGNSWLRYLIEGAIGIFTGSFFPGKCMVTYGYFGDAVPYTSGLVSLIKSHGHLNTPQFKFSSDAITHPRDTKYQMIQTSRNGIILIRNPFRAIFSYRNYIENGIFPPSTNASLYHGEAWNQFIYSSIQLWENFYVQWIKEGSQIHIVYYEELKSEKLRKHLNDLANFINFTIDEERLSCVLKHPVGKFRRRETCFDPITNPKDTTDHHVYLDDHVILINAAIQRVSKIIKERNFDSSIIDTYKNSNFRIEYCTCE